MKDYIGIQEMIHNVCHGRASEKKGDVIILLPIIRHGRLIFGIVEMN